MGEISNAALKEILSSVDFELISFKHFHFMVLLNLAMMNKDLQKYQQIRKKIILYKNHLLYLLK